VLSVKDETISHSNIQNCISRYPNIHHTISRVTYDKLTVKTNNETVQVAYDYHYSFLLSVLTLIQQVKEEKQEQEGQVETFKSNQKHCIGKTLQNDIKPSQRKVCYDKEKQTLTITIPRVKSKQER